MDPDEQLETLPLETRLRREAASLLRHCTPDSARLVCRHRHDCRRRAAGRTTLALAAATLAGLGWLRWSSNALSTWPPAAGPGYSAPGTPVAGPRPGVEAVRDTPQAAAEPPSGPAVAVSPNDSLPAAELPDPPGVRPVMLSLSDGSEVLATYVPERVERVSFQNLSRAEQEAVLQIIHQQSPHYGPY